MVAVVGGEKERGAGAADGGELAQGAAAVAAQRDLHEAVEQEERAFEARGVEGGVRGEFGGVGVVELDWCGAFGGEGDRLIDEFLGEVEGDEVLITEGVKGDADASGAAAGLEKRGGAVGEMTLDHQAFAGPEADVVGGLGVVDDGAQVVEVLSDLGGGDGASGSGGTSRHERERGRFKPFFGKTGKCAVRRARGGERGVVLAGDHEAEEAAGV